ncbi:beta/gamma crystallin domain-containing protein 1-like isoform X2 [Echeneis naucrates]|uniref:beta/gamma crystallin domain-containing protein 1-like isoform X2 n=1 Tax=Echeneis naucrates TaxID=173247 RepID=UPI0011133087|nr:beta/gamma crystallin domain-containing protein 1-like isoform X2 [Echeneis naucrates]
MSESPEEQPSTGVLGRIGSWFSPWKGKGPTSPTENASRSGDLSPLLEGDEESEKSGRPQRGEKLWQDKKEHSSSPDLLTLSGDSFLCEEKDATQSAHRHGSAGRSTETGEGGPKEEEFVACQKKKIGQGKESEERSNGTSVSGIPERNASHLTHLSSSSKQGAAWDSDQAHAQPQAKRQAQAQAGKRLHVYLEETSVIQGAENIGTTQEVVRTKVTESLQALSKSSQSSDSPKFSSTKRAENKRTNVRPATGSQSYYSALVGLSLKSHKETELETAPDKEQTDSGNMGRKNTAKRRVRKNSQGDGATSPQEKMSPNAQTATEGFPSSDNSETDSQGKSPKTNKGESFADSTSTHHPAPQTSPEGGESHISCPDNIKQLDNFQDSNSVTADTLVHVVGGSADMDDDESLYKVERKTETPESKRRSIKVSRSEVKLFTKSVTLNQTPAAENRDFESALKKKEDKEEETAKAKTDARLHDPKKSDEESKPVVGQITEKISLFEQREHKQAFQTPRSADVSPVRKGTERLQADLELASQRSKSADRHRSSSASPAREEPLTIKERMKNFTPTSKSALPQKLAMTGMSHKSTVTIATSELPELDCQGRRDTKEQRETTVSKITLKPDGQDTTPAGVNYTIQQKQPTESTPKDTVALKPADKLKPTNLQSTVLSKAAGDSSDPKLIDTVALKTTDQSTKHNSVESDVPAKDDSKTTDAASVKTRDHGSRPNSVDSDMKTKGAGDSLISKRTDSVALKTTDANTKPNCVESDALTIGAGDSLETASNVSPQTKGPSRTGSRSKRKKGKEPTSPTSLNRENKPTSKQEVTAIKQEQMDDTVETVSTSKQLTQKVSSSSDKARESTAEKQSQPETRQKDFKKEVEVLKKEKQELDSTPKKHSVDKPGKRKEGPPEPSFLKDEPDTAASNTETKKPIDKDPGILPKKEEKKGGHSVVVTSASKKTKDPAASSPSPAAIKPIEKTLSAEQESPVETPKLDKESSVLPDSKNQENLGPQSKKDKELKSLPQKKDTEPITSAEVKDVRKPQKTNQTEKKEKEKPQQLLSSDRNTTDEKVSDSGPGISGTGESAAQKNDRKNAGGKEQPRPITGIEKLEAASQSPELTSASSDGLPAQARHAGQMATAHPEKAAICAITQTDEPVSRTKSDTGPSKTEASINVPVQKSIENSRAEGKPVDVAEEAQANSVSVEKTENLPDDSHTHGANDVELSSQRPIIRGTTVTTAAEKVTEKAANGTQAQKNILTESVTEKQPATKSASSQGEGRVEKNLAVKTFPSEDKISGDINKLAASPSLKAAEEIPQSHYNSEASKPKINVATKTAEKILSLQVKEPPLVANDDISPHPQLLTTKKEPVNSKQSTTSKLPTSPEAHKMSPDSIQHLPKKKLHLPRGLCKDDFATQQDAPSSWLDVDFPKRKMKIQQPKLSSAGSESNLLDGELDDDDFIEKIKKLCAPFSLPPRKHNHLRPPQPPFAMPAIKEDRFEKTFDPEDFKFGLRKKNNFTLDTPPSLLAKLQSVETKAGLKPARASLADRSVLLSNLDADSWLKDKVLVKDEVDTKEEKDDKIKLKSRLEGSCVFSSLTSSSIRGKRNGVETKAEGSGSEDRSASKTPRLSSPPLSQLQPPFPNTTASMKDTLGQQQSSALSSTEEAQAAEAVVSDSGPPLPSFNDIKLPDYLEKLIHREHEKPVQSTQAQEQVHNKAIGKMTTPVPEGEALKPGLLPDAGPSCFPVTPPSKQPTLPEQPQRTLHNHIRTDKGFHKRPGKMVLFEKAEFSGQAYEIYRDVADSTSLQLSPLISVKVVRGCWVLYEKPNFQGRLIALEEGGIELTNMWAEPGLETKPMVIGSIRLAVWDYCIPHIDLFTEPEGRGRVTPYHDDTIETGSFGIPMNTASIQVHSGVWLVFSDPGFQGMLSVLETGVYPFPEIWGFSSPFVGSLRPLKMGAFKVENPSEIKAVVYEKPGFQGSCLEIDSELFGFSEDEEDIVADCTSFVSQKLKSVGSLKIIGGLWVGYSQPGFEGQQFILEEGEFLDCNDWGGAGQLLSLRPVLADFMSPQLKMFSDRDFGELGMNINLSVPVINMDDTGYGTRTQSIDVIGGVWVVFEEPGFCGESYILEKGLYGNPEDWGALQPRVASAMPVLLDDFQHASKFKVQIFSDPGFQGSVLSLDEGMASLQDGFSVASCKVLAGSWLAFEGQDFTGRMYVLEVGNYPDLRAMGCDHPSSSILSMQTVGFEFSLPSITLFERCSLRGKRVVLTDGSVNLQLTGGCSRVQSLLVEGGMWVLYDGVNYRGGQILLKPGEILDWRKFSSWQKIGSLRPLVQKQVHFRVRNRQTGLMMSVSGDLEDVKLLRLQEAEENDGLEQIWSYHNGHLHCKLLEECCLSPSGSVTMAGSRMGLSPEPDHHIHLWSITPEGFIRYTPTPDLVLEVKGGHHYDKNQVILNTLDPNKQQQRWNVEII